VVSVVVEILKEKFGHGGNPFAMYSLSGIPYYTTLHGHLQPLFANFFNFVKIAQTGAGFWEVALCKTTKRAALVF
jgi:hypothetical protein